MERNGSVLGSSSRSPTLATNSSNWLRTQGANKNAEGNGNGDDASNSTTSVIIDLFQERKGGAGGSRVGRDFQAKIPNIIQEQLRNAQGENDRALVVWRPTEKLTDAEIEEYISMATEKFQYTGHQALGLLYWHRYDIQRATQDVAKFTPHPEEWTKEDKIFFKQAFQHGKSFENIRQILPHKSMSSLIRYYLSQEEEDSRTPETNGSGIMTIQGHHENKKIPNDLHPQHIIQETYRWESNDEKQTGDASSCCGNCGVPCSGKYTKDNLCNTCFLYWKNTGNSRPLTGPIRRGEKSTLGLLRQRGSPPKGMNINHDDLSMLAKRQPQAENVILEGLEKEVLDMKSRIHHVKQHVQLLRRGLPKMKPVEKLGCFQ